MRNSVVSKSSKPARLSLSLYRKSVAENLGFSFSDLPPADKDEIKDLIKWHHRLGYSVDASSALLLKKCRAINS